MCIRDSYEAEGIAIGASIACAGVCLTVTALRARTDGESGCVFQVEAAAETLAKTSVGSWEPGTRINLERSLKVGEELGGHLVTGHVDGVGRILKICLLYTSASVAAVFTPSTTEDCSLPISSGVNWELAVGLRDFAKLRTAFSAALSSAGFLKVWTMRSGDRAISESSRSKASSCLLYTSRCV